ncbi:MAG TPA: hypothetical protein VMC61_05985 [Methanocella sp.]|nr:hypothetical protein [Methanocella sp.]
MGRIIAAIIAIIAFVLAWRLLDIFLGLTFGVMLWAVKAVLFLVLLYVVWRLFAGRYRHPAPR